MLSTIEAVNSVVNNFIWGVPAMICIIGVGLYLSIRTRFLQIRKFPYSMKVTLGRMMKKKEASDGDLSRRYVPLSQLPLAPVMWQVWQVPSPSAVPVRYSGCGYLRCLACAPSSPR